MPNRPTYPRIALPPALAARVDALRAMAPAGRPSRQAVVERALAVGLDALEGDGPDADEATVPGMVREVVYGSGTEGPGGPSLKTILFGHEPTPMDRARDLLDALPRCSRPGCGRPATRGNARVDDLTCDDCDTGYKRDAQTGDLPYAAALRAFQGARGATDAPKPGPAPADAPTGSPGPAMARRLARQARAAGLDASARTGVVTVTAAPIWHPMPGDPRWGVDDVGKSYVRESHTVSDARPDGKRVEVAVCAGDTLAIVRQALATAWRASDGRATMAAERARRGT